MPADGHDSTSADQDVPRLTLDVPQVAQALGISRTLAYDLVKQGTLPGVWLTPHRVVVPIDAIRRLLEGGPSPLAAEGDDWTGRHRLRGCTEDLST